MGGARDTAHCTAPPASHMAGSQDNIQVGGHGELSLREVGCEYCLSVRVAGLVSRTTRETGAALPAPVNWSNSVAKQAAVLL